MSRFVQCAATALVCSMFLSTVAWCEPTTAPSTKPVKPKELSASVNKGLDWLAKAQLESGAWGQGEEAAGMRGDNQPIRDQGNVADTAAAALALMRAGSTPTDGPHAKNIAKAVDFVCDSVEKSDLTSLRVSDVQGTRLQSKLGKDVDTFLAALLLAEVQAKMPDEASNLRVAQSMDKILLKIQRNQKDDGSFVEGGWAPVLAQGICSKAINRAAQNGVKVDEAVRERAEKYARAQYDERGKSFGGAGAAGVDLYAASANLGTMKDSNDSNAQQRAAFKSVAESPATAPAEREVAQQQLRRFDDNEKEMADATRTVVDRLADKKFVNGFGSNGGEEFLSYMNIGETLVAQGGEDWEKWDKSISENLNRVQNDDGSWSGQHCITGRTFCTAAAVLTLTVDRATTPIASELKR